MWKKRTFHFHLHKKISRLWIYYHRLIFIWLQDLNFTCIYIKHICSVARAKLWSFNIDSWAVSIVYNWKQNFTKTIKMLWDQMFWKNSPKFSTSNGDSFWKSLSYVYGRIHDFNFNLVFSWTSIVGSNVECINSI